MIKKRILLVDDEEDLVKVLYKRLSGAGYTVFRAPGGKDIFELIRDVMPDLILLDIMLQEIDGMQIKAKLNEDITTAQIPVIFLTVRNEISAKVNGFRLGAEDYVTKPFNMELLLARINSALSRRDFYREVSMKDGLTGLYNISFLKEQIAIFFNMAKRYKKTFSVAIIDINNFKHINDTYGHAAGDFVLKNFSYIAKQTLRKSDIITRYGGDEFIILMLEADNEQANRMIERLKDNIKGKVFVFQDGVAEITFSISAGIATYDDVFTEWPRIFELADARLYEDKKTK